MCLRRYAAVRIHAVVVAILKLWRLYSSRDASCAGARFRLATSRSLGKRRGVGDEGTNAKEERRKPSELPELSIAYTWLQHSGHVIFVM